MAERTRRVDVAGRLANSRSLPRSKLHSHASKSPSDVSPSLCRVPRLRGVAAGSGVAGGGYGMLLGNPGFRRLWLAQTVSRAGDSIHYVAIVVLVFDLTESGLSVSGTVIFEALPVVLFGALAGAVVDRYRRRTVMIAADLTRAGLALLMARATSLPEVYALAFGLSLAGLVSGPSVQALVPGLVGRDVLGRANALLWSGVQSSHVLGSAIGGGIVALAGPRGAFVVNAATFVASAGMLLGVREADTAPGADRTERRLFSEAREGIRYAAGDAFLRRLLVVQTLAVLSVGGTGALLVVLARDQLGIEGGEFGLLVAAIGVGAFLGPIVLGHLFDKRQSTAFLFIPYGLRGLIDATLGFMRGLWLPAGLLFVYGLNTSTGGVAYNTILQRHVPDRFRGRAFATLGVAWQVGRLVSIAAAGILADLVSVRFVYIAAGALLGVAGLLGLRLITFAGNDHQDHGADQGGRAAGSDGGYEPPMNTRPEVARTIDDTAD